MNIKMLITVLFLTCAGNGFAQPNPYNVVFDLTDGDTATHQKVIRWVKGILEAHPDAKVEVVFYGKALPMVEKAYSTVSEDVKMLTTNRNVNFSVCEQAMKAHHVEKAMLIPGVNTVPEAVYELISKQADGFGYIKVITDH